MPFSTKHYENIPLFFTLATVTATVAATACHRERENRDFIREMILKAPKLDSHLRPRYENTALLSFVITM